MTRISRRAEDRPPSGAETLGAAPVAGAVRAGRKDVPEALRALDPAADRPEYWDAFRAGVMERVAFELARRRAAARQSVAAVLSGWSRSLVPVAVAAAAIAAVVIGAEARRGPDPSPQLVLRDMLGDDAGARPFAAAPGDPVAGAAAFMALVEGGRP